MPCRFESGLGHQLMANVLWSFFYYFAIIEAMNKKRVKIFSFTSLLAVLLLSAFVYFAVPQYFADEIYPLKYTDWIVKYSKKYNVDPALVCGVILQESRFNPNARSGAGAQGLMQFMPSTAATMARETGRWPKYDIFDTETSIEFGAAHLRDLLNGYNNNVDLALYAYNTGNAYRFVNSPSLVAKYPYVRKIRNYQTVYQTMYSRELGLDPITIEPKKPDKYEIRGFVWSQIFNNFAGYFEKS